MINIFLSIKKRKMIKIVSFIFIFLVAFSLVGCTKISNIFEEKEIIYESEDKKVRLEVAFRTSKIGKIYINKEGVEKAFVVSYINEKQINVYIKPPLLEESYLELDVSYFNYDKFSQNAEGYGYFIMAFFNEVPDFSNPITLYDNGAHLIFVKRKYKNKNEFISYNNEIEKTSDDFFNFYRGKQNKNKQFIFGVIIKG